MQLSWYKPIPSSPYTRPVIPALRGRGQRIRSSKSLTCYIEFEGNMSCRDRGCRKGGRRVDFSELSRSALFTFLLLSFLPAPPPFVPPLPSLPPFFLPAFGFFLHHLKHIVRTCALQRLQCPRCLREGLSARTFPPVGTDR